MTNLICKCGKEIRKFSVVVKDKCYRTDYRMNSKGRYFRYDREYFAGDTESIIYRCECSKKPHQEIVIDGIDLNDFSRIDVSADSEINLGDDLKENEYGDITVQRNVK